MSSPVPIVHVGAAEVIVIDGSAKIDAVIALGNIPGICSVKDVVTHDPMTAG